MFSIFTFLATGQVYEILKFQSNTTTECLVLSKECVVLIIGKVSKDLLVN